MLTEQPSFLREIIELKRQRLAGRGLLSVTDEVRAEGLAARARRGGKHLLRKRLSATEGFQVIAEFKRASPSRGDIRRGADPAEVARAYEAGGAAAISVLTEEDRFLGSGDDLLRVREAVDLPLLRKDFIFEEAQVYESAALGADALLLIVAALDDERLAGLRHLTEEVLGMDALVEVHTAAEMARAAAAGARLIGVNNRDLHTFRVSLETSIELSGRAPEDALLVTESGLRTGADLRRLKTLGYAGFLIGETLMRLADPAEGLRALLREA